MILFVRFAECLLNSIYVKKIYIYTRRIKEGKCNWHVVSNGGSEGEEREIEKDNLTWEILVKI